MLLSISRNSLQTPSLDEILFESFTLPNSNISVKVMIRWKRSFEIFFDWPLCWWYWKWKNHRQVLKNPCIIATHPRLSETAQQTFFGLQDVLKTSSRHVLETSSASLQRHNFLSSRTSCKYVFKMSWRRLWRRMAKTNILVLIKTSWRRLEDVFWRHLQDVFWRRRRKTSSRRLQDVLIKTNACWEFS